MGTFFDSYGLFTFLMVTALFVFAVDRLSKVNFGAKSSKIIRELSADTLGAYLLHIGFMEMMQPLGVHSMMLPNIVGIPVFGILCFAVCLGIAGVLRRIPVIGKYIC